MKPIRSLYIYDFVDLQKRARNQRDPLVTIPLITFTGVTTILITKVSGASRDVVKPSAPAPSVSTGSSITTPFTASGSRTRVHHASTVTPSTTIVAMGRKV